MWTAIYGLIKLVQYSPWSFWPSVFIEKSGVIQMSMTLYASWPFSYVAFNMLSLFWTFIILNMYCEEFPFWWSYRGQKQWGRKGLISDCNCRLAWRDSGQVLKTGTWKKKLKQKLWRNAAYRFAPHVLLSLFSCIRTNDWQASWPSVCWVHAYQSLIRNMPHKLIYRPIWYRHSPS